jgi:hypothetical protein
MGALRRLRDFVSVRTDSRFAQKRTLEDKLCEKVAEFMDLKKLLLPSLYAALITQRSRAVLRLLGLQYFAKLALSLNSVMLIPDLLRHLSMALRKPVEQKEEKATPSSSSSSSSSLSSSNINIDLFGDGSQEVLLLVLLDFSFSFFFACSPSFFLDCFSLFF